jgi:DNA polymerase IV
MQSDGGQAGTTAPEARRILHVDMDAFFASVEQRDRPELRGRPVAVGGQPAARGVVAAASYEARRFGVRSAMPSARAARLCPELVFVPPAHHKYVEDSARLREVFLRFTPLIEPVALDECFLDVTGHFDGFGSATEIARQIKAAVRDELHLTCSAGVAPSKFVAKVASDLRKPDGLVVVPPEKVLDFLAPLPVGVIWGIGPKTNRSLEAMGVRTIHELRGVALAELVARFGKAGYRLSELAHGRDSSAVRPDRELKQISRECTFGSDLLGLSVVRSELDALLDELSERIERSHKRFRAVHLKVRYADFVTVTRSLTLPAVCGPGAALRERAHELLARTEAGRRPVRLLGVGVGELEHDSPQLELPFA